MKEDENKAGKSIGLMWAASLVATALITLFTTLYFQNASLMNDAGSFKKLTLLADMRVNLLRSVEKEKSAVMAMNDEDSAGFAEQSKAASRAVARDLKKLEAISSESVSDKEKELVGKFRKSWEEVQHIDTGLLESVMQNTNVKAVSLSNTIGTELMHKIDDNLAKLTVKVTPPARRMQMDNIAKDARLAMRNIAIFQTRHIDAAAESDKKKLEASIRTEQEKVNAALKTLDKMTGRKSRVYIREALTDYGEFMRVNDEIVRLSKLNTNRNTAALSLGKKRMAETECDRALEALQKEVAGQKSSGKH
jgi:hypothetical protein